MSKLAFFVVTLIAAIPAAWLAFQAVMGFLGHAGEMPMVLMGVNGVTLLVCAAIVVMPIAVLLRPSSRSERSKDEEEFEDQDEAEEADDEKGEGDGAAGDDVSEDDDEDLVFDVEETASENDTDFGDEFDDEDEGFDYLEEDESKR